MIFRIQYNVIGEMLLEVRPFDNVKDQIGYCGIWCGSCPGGNGAILEVARRFKELAKRSELERWVPKDFDFKEFMKGLKFIQTMSMCPGCLKGGGNPSCGIRICAVDKKVTSCSQCAQLAECKNFGWLEENYPTVKEELRKIAGKDQKELIEKWTGELRKKWPHCVLFLDRH
jgi:hypothetical protein